MSLLRNSLIHRKIQGKFQNLAANTQNGPGFLTVDPSVTPKFPMHRNREFSGTNRELFPADQGKSLAKSPADGTFGKDTGAAPHLTPQNDQLMSECRVLCFKPALRLEWQGQDEAEQCKHCALTLGNSFSRSNADEVFGTDSQQPAPLRHRCVCLTKGHPSGSCRQALFSPAHDHPWPVRFVA